MITFREAGHLPEVEVLPRLAGRKRLPVLFHSGGPVGPWSRYSIFCMRPSQVARMAPNEEDPIRRLDQLLRGWRLPENAIPPPLERLPFLAGAAGYFGYEMGRARERLPRPRPDDVSLPPSWFGFYPCSYIVDRIERRGWIVGWDREGRAPIEDRLAEMESLLAEAAACPPLSLPPALAPENWTTLFETSIHEEEYRRRVARILEYIAAGDIYQANLTFRAKMATDACGADLSAAVAQINPSPFGAYIGGGDFEIVSSSPELLLRLGGRQAITRPIKGTVPRSENPAEDRRRAAWLRHSEKDAAENIMIVDLERNDLGRVCEFGSVRAGGLLEVESFPNVHHLVSTVEGRLRPEVTPLDALLALFPGGSVTGAPKIRAMEIIHELEPCPRHVYTGAIGYFDIRGGAQFNVAIRTAVVADGAAWFNVGGGIVADSDPDREYQECLNKGRALARAMLSLAPEPARA